MSGASRWRVIVLLAALWLPAAAVAETARVRSGDHADRTRLVIELATPAAWRLGRSTDGYAIAIDRPGIEFDLDEAFRLISRDRVATLTAAPGGSRLDIRLGCDCHAEARDFNDSWILIDILDGPAPEDSPFEADFVEAEESPADPAEDDGAALPRRLTGLGQAAPGRFVAARPRPAPPDPAATQETTVAPPPETVAVTEPPVEAPVDAPPPAAPSAQLPALGQDWRSHPAEPIPGAELAGEAPLAVTRARTGSLPAIGDPSETERIAVQEAALLEELARAAAQGLLEPRLPTLERLRERQAAPEESPAPDPPPALPAPEDHFRLRAETSIDRDAGGQLPRRELTDDGIACLSDTAVDLAAWGDEGEPAEGIATRRARLVGEFDRADPEAVLALARYYLSLGFGAEARATLKAFGPDQPEFAVLAALAAVVDGEGEGLPGPLAGQSGCEGAVALWSLLAEQGPKPGERPNLDAVVATFSGLPLHLRRSLGPDLAARFLETGDRDTAMRLRNAVARANGDHGGGMDLLEARLALAGGDPTASEKLAALAGAGEPTASAAYRLYLETELAAGHTPPEGAATAAALAFELGGTEEGVALAELAVRSLLAGGEFDTARAEIERLSGERPESGARLWPAFADTLTLGAPDAVFLTQVFEARAPLTEAALAPATALALAERLTGLGFPELALQFLPQADADDGFRLARATALLAQEEPAEALDAATGLDGEAAEALRGRALLALDRPGAAAARFAAAGDAGAAARAAWLAGAWDLLAESEAPAIRTLAEARLAQARAAESEGSTDTSVARPPAGRVEAARDTLERAGVSRAAAQDLLTAPPPGRDPS